MKALFFVVVTALPMAAQTCSGAPPRPAVCQGTNTQVVATGAQRPWTNPLAQNTTLRAVGGTWVNGDPYEVSFLGAASGACMVRGTIVSLWPDTDSWSKWHDRAALRFSQPNFTVFAVHLANNGDGLKPKDDAGGQAQDFHVEGSWIQHMHDDCLENDYLHAGTIRDNLFDGCYVMFSSRPWTSGVSGRQNIVAIDHNIGALEPMRTVFSGASPGTGGFFKWSTRAPGVILTDNVFMAKQLPNHGTLDPPTGPLLCARNVIVWEGSGAFPSDAAWHARCPDTVVTTNPARYTNARAAWLTNHVTGA